MDKQQQGHICVDLDGCLAEYSSWQGSTNIGRPIPLMLERVNKWLFDGRKVKIMTARVSSKNPDRKIAKEAIERWCVMHIGQKLEVTAEKDFGMIELWDDRAVTVGHNTGEVLTDLERMYG